MHLALYVAAGIVVAAGPGVATLLRGTKDANASVGGAGEGRASASPTGFAPATKRVRASPCSTRPGIGSDAARRVSALTGSGAGLATSTRLPNLRPRSTPGSATTHACGNTDRTVATCARACVSGTPSATLAANTPVSRSALRTAAANSDEVRWAGVRPPANTSAITTSNDPAASRSSTALASPIRIRTRRVGSWSRTRSTSAASISTASCSEPGRVAVT
jgi:hypothetical protein